VIYIDPVFVVVLIGWSVFAPMVFFIAGWRAKGD
jgi:hypothetical protein